MDAKSQTVIIQFLYFAVSQGNSCKLFVVLSLNEENGAHKYVFRASGLMFGSVSHSSKHCVCAVLLNLTYWIKETVRKRKSLYFLNYTF